MSIKSKIKEAEDKKPDEEEEEEVEGKEEDKAESEKCDDEKKKKSIKEDVALLMNGENVSEDFITKTEVFLETALNARIYEEKEIIKENYEEFSEYVIKDSLDKAYTTMVGKVNSYLDYIAEEWIEENKIGIESGLRTEITEEFITGMKELFENHYVDIPEEKLDVVSELEDKITKISESLDEEMNKNIELKSLVESNSKSASDRELFDIAESICEDVPASMKEKLMDMSAQFSFSDKADFTKRMKSLKETYCGQNKTDEEDDSGIITEESTGNVNITKEAMDMKILSEAMSKLSGK